jgi:hypothetical protein
MSGHNINIELAVYGALGLAMMAYDFFSNKNNWKLLNLKA